MRRIWKLKASVTNSELETESSVMPLGPLNVDDAGAPLRLPTRPVPASVLTARDVVLSARTTCPEKSTT
jgi:hypothetical protein